MSDSHDREDVLPLESMADMTSESFPNQAARVLEYIELLEIQYEEEIDRTVADLKNGLRICAVALRGYLEDSGHHPIEPIEAMTA